MATSTTFHPLSKLPSELRIKIWKHALPAPCVVPIRFSRTYNKYTTNTAPHILLQISPESRAVYLETYSKLKLSPAHKSSIYVDFRRDTLYFDTLDCSPAGDLALDIAKSPCKDWIRHIAVEAQLWEVLRVFRYESLSEIRSLRGLESIALVMTKDWEGGGGLGVVPVGDEMGAARDRRAARVNGNNNGNGNGNGNVNVNNNVMLLENGGFVEVESGTVQADLRQVAFYVETLRWEIANGIENYWVNGPPSVKMWVV